MCFRNAGVCCPPRLLCLALLVGFGATSLALAACVFAAEYCLYKMDFMKRIGITKSARGARNVTRRVRHPTLSSFPDKEYLCYDCQNCVLIPEHTPTCKTTLGCYTYFEKTTDARPVLQINRCCSFPNPQSKYVEGRCFRETDSRLIEHCHWCHTNLCNGYQSFEDLSYNEDDEYRH